MFGFGSALALQDLEDEDIKYIEEKIRTKTLSILSPDSDQNFSKHQKIDIYGFFHANTPSEFEFLPGEKKMIKRLVKHVKSQIESKGEENAYQHFVCKTNRKRQQIHRSSVGTFFSKNTYKLEKLAGISSQTSPPNTCSALISNNSTKQLELEKLLFDKANNLLKKHGLLDDGQYFLKDMVSASILNEGVTGTVVCIFCKTKKNVFFDSTYWVLSNFAKHITKCKIRNNVPIVNSSMIIEQGEESNALETLSNDKNQTNTGKFSNEILCILGDEEHNVYIQICQQNTRMRAAVLQNGDNEITVNVSLDKKTHKNIKICPIVGNGNCLFASLAHQLYYPQIDSLEHNNHTLKLRKELVQHIQQDFDFYKQALKGRIVFKHSEAEKLSNIDIIEKAKQFLYDELPRPGVWGGSEILLAVSKVHQVNVIVFDENSSCNILGDFNFDYKRCLIIFYRKESNHYDSVSKIDPELSYECMKTLIKTVSENNNKQSVDLN